MSDVMDRTVEQRMIALEKANALRLYQASIKRAIKAGDVSVIDILRCNDKKLQSAKIYALVRATPKIGSVKIDRAFDRAGVSPVKRLGGMTERQRFALIEQLQGYKAFR